MARTLNRLKSKQLDALGPGRHADGGGLYLDRDAHGRSRWVFLWTRDGRRREMGLGAAGKDGVAVAAARAAAASARAVVSEGGDPIAARDAAKRQPVRVPTFGEFADALVESLAPQWRNAKHVDQWRMTLTRYAKPLRSHPVDKIDAPMVLEVLRPIWKSKPETASRVRGRIEKVLDAAKAEGHRDGENPARWRGHLSHLLGPRQKLTRGHQRALPYPALASFMARLREREGTAALALEFLILTAARSGEVRGARWSEIDLAARVWTVPRERMKAFREQRVPLSERAVEILEEAAEGATLANDGRQLVFPGPGHKPLSVNAFRALLVRMKADVTAHGFRSTFRDWAGEVSPFPRELAEVALAHAVGDATERAYRRLDGLEKRREMMEAWSQFASVGPKQNVIVQLATKRAL